MRFLCLTGALLALTCNAALGGDPASVLFDKTSYQLAAVSISPDGVVTNDYVKEGETAEKWTSLLSVRYFPTAETINHAINPWLQSVRTQLTKKWSAMQTPNADTESDITIEAWVSSGTSLVDATVQRFVPHSSGMGVIAYRFVEKVDPAAPGEKEEFIRKKQGRIERLGQLKIEPVKEKS